MKNVSNIDINDFPLGPYGFELVLRFCYNNGKIHINVSNVLILQCCAIYLEMNEEFFNNNLLQQTHKFLEGIYDWKWNEILLSLKSFDCEIFFAYANSYGLLEKIICALLAKLSQNSDFNLITSSPESELVKRITFSPKIIKSSSFSNKEWWFEDLATLSPKIIEKFLHGIEAYKKNNKNLFVTRFLLYYMKKATNCNKIICDYASLAETASYGVIFFGNKNFSCRGIFWILKIVSKFGISEDCRIEMEKLIGGMFEKATLDDLLVSGNEIGLYYDVGFVIRLIKVFVEINGVDLEKMKKVGGLIDKYLIEISPDQKLKISKFLEVAECLPDFARDCFDGIYRAIDIYLEVNIIYLFLESTFMHFIF